MSEELLNCGMIFASFAFIDNFLCKGSSPFLFAVIALLSGSFTVGP
jgi:hypothetical protein